ncbi:AAA family ATPase [Streptomyces sp. DSM 44915]|uniref:AAA family ATPase n=1 Tax=Streptomyces chisholmiae TaxID=3075540 RepID=A0ABU2JV40_9ACTN|nr:AAA family ATPase [Streptomyces sp. DSM 44915]MDT0268857.1 AAA family ATPase [Streptomyces sp. DSM 44915]
MIFDGGPAGRPLPGACPGGGRPAALAARLAGLAPSVGGVRLVGIDGHAGSGKSTLARALAAELPGTPVLHLDDLASHEAFFDWTDVFLTRVVAPLARGEVAHYPVYDWTRRAFTASATLPPAPVVLVEGVGAGRRAVRPRLALLIWLDVAPEVAWRRGRRRDGPAQAGFWDAWERAELHHFADDPSRPFADILMTSGGDSHHACE